MTFTAASQQQLVHFKTTLNRSRSGKNKGETNRFTASYTFSDLMQHVERLWGPRRRREERPLVISYVDEEGDSVRLCGEQDWEECLRLYRTHGYDVLRLTVRLPTGRDEKNDDSADPAGEEDSASEVEKHRESRKRCRLQDPGRDSSCQAPEPQQQQFLSRVQHLVAMKGAGKKRIEAAGHRNVPVINLEGLQDLCRGHGGFLLVPVKSVEASAARTKAEEAQGPLSPMVSQYREELQLHECGNALSVTQGTAAEAADTDASSSSDDPEPPENRGGRPCRKKKPRFERQPLAILFDQNDTRCAEKVGYTIGEGRRFLKNAGASLAGAKGLTATVVSHTGNPQGAPPALAAASSRKRSRSGEEEVAGFMIGDGRRASAAPGLPHDLLKSALDFLPRNQQLMARLVNEDWGRAVADVIESQYENGRTLTLTPKDGEWNPATTSELLSVLYCLPDMTDTFKALIRHIQFPQTFSGLRGMNWKALESMPNLQQLDLSGTMVGTLFLSPALQSLKVIRLVGCERLNFNDEGSVQGLEWLPALEELDLTRVASVRSVSHLSACTALKKLVLNGCYQLTDDGILGLELIPTLEELSLSETSVSTVAHLSTCKSLKQLDLSNCFRLTDQGIVGLELIPTLEQLCLFHARVTTVAHLSACKSLKQLSVQACGKLTDDGIIGLEQIPTLEELFLPDTDLTTVAHLSGCKALKKLDLAGCCELTDDGILGLELIPSLEELVLSGKERIHLGAEITTVGHLSACKALNKLDLSHCYQLTAEGIVGLEQIPTLEELVLSQNTKLTTVANLSACKALKILDLSHCPQLTDDGILGLEQIPTLEELNLSITKVTTVAHLSRSKSLKVLVLKYCNLTDDGIIGLEQIPTLEKLILVETNFTTVAHLSGCKALKKLDLEGCCELTDDGILGLEQIPTLEELFLTDTHLTTVAHLSGCKALKKLDLAGCCELTVDGILGLEQIPTLVELVLS